MVSQLKYTAIALAAAVALLFPTSALAYTSAPLTICNQVNFRLEIAYGYRSPGIHDPADHSLLTGPVVSQGWRAVDPGACVTLENTFGARYMYWFVAKTYGGGDPIGDSAIASIRNAGGPHFCVNNWIFAVPDGGTPAYSVPAAAFVYEHENESADACDKQATMTAHNFWVVAHEVDTWVNATVNYTPQMVGKP